MQNILIISAQGTETPISDLATALRGAGYNVERTSLDRVDPAEIDFLCRAFDGRPPDLLIADLSLSQDMLPLRHTIRLLRLSWGDAFPLPACLLLVEFRHLDVAGWEVLMDDFILPPYSPHEIISRIKLLLFRKRNIDAGDTLSIGEMMLDLASGRALSPDGQNLLLTPREFDLLRFLASHRGKFFARDSLLDMVWGVDFSGGERTVDIHIRRLRAKLPPSAADLLETRRSIGYGLKSSAH